MQNEAILMLVTRIISSVLCVATIVAGIYLVKNYRKFFGADPAMPSEMSSSRAYSQTLVWLAWIHALIFTGACALMLH